VVYCKLGRFPSARDRRALGGLFTCLVPPETSSGLFLFFVRCRGDDDAVEGSGGMSDRTLTCRDCGQAFTFTAGEQAFYAERGFSEPQRCPSCRAARKAQRSSSGYDSGSGYSGGGSYSSGGYSGGSGGYSSGGYSGGGGGYSSGGGGGGGYSSGPRQMYPAVCSECGRETEVPFQPRTDKPVYCRECFQLRRSAMPPRNYNY
jgi:CxxC-x17-CxxC domain-containing protein